MKNPFASRLFILACLLQGFLSVGQAQNLLLNPDFKGAFGGSNIASNWNDNSTGTISVAYERESLWPQKGAYAQKIVTSNVSASSAMQFKQNVGVTAERVYRVRIALKSDQAALPLRIQLRQTVAPWRSYIESTVLVSRGWQTFEFEGVASATETVFFMLRQETAGTLWIDSASLVDVGAAALANVAGHAENQRQRHAIYRLASRYDLQLGPAPRHDDRRSAHGERRSHFGSGHGLADADTAAVTFTARTIVSPDRITPWENQAIPTL